MKNKLLNVLFLLLIACLMQFWHNVVFGPNKESKYFDDNRLIEKEWLDEIREKKYIFFGVQAGVSENFKLMRQVLEHYPYEQYQLLFMMEPDAAALLGRYLENGEPELLEQFQARVSGTEYASAEMLDLIRFLRDSSKNIQVLGFPQELRQLPEAEEGKTAADNQGVLDPELPVVGILTREAVQKKGDSGFLEKLMEDPYVQASELAAVGVFYDDSEYFDSQKGRKLRIDESHDLQFRVGRERLRQGKFVYFRLPETEALRDLNPPLSDFPELYDYFISIIGGAASSPLRP